MRTVTVYLDYVCPFCLLAEQVLSDAIGNRNIRIFWRGFELRPQPVPTLRPEDPYLPAIWKRSVYSLAERLGVPIKLPSISPQPRTEKAFELLALAQDRGLDHPYSMQVLRAFFQEDRDIGNPEILIELAAKAGIDPGEARQALETGAYLERHREALRYAREDMAITSVPTIIVGAQVFRGTPSRDELLQALERLERASGD
ncbi:DsbA family protein [uncultured Nitratireductor sp.]|uniref:DsbA family oxidoreductase n=1 Tax=uncultured Nitratireductor sp. TaxID=520953 RepID=UPI0025E5857C|nr:DsbA family protein [uncultured Nitratireductor sp.]